MKLNLSDFNSLYELFAAFSFAYAGLEGFKEKIINNFSEYKINKKFDVDINRLHKIFQNEITSSTYESSEYSPADINKQEKALENELDKLRDESKIKITNIISTYFSNSKIISILSGVFYLMLLIYSGLYSSEYFNSNVNIYFYVYLSVLFFCLMLFYQTTRFKNYSISSIYLAFIFIMSLFIAIPYDCVIIAYLKELFIYTYLPIITILFTISIFIIFVILVPILKMKSLSDKILQDYQDESILIWDNYPVLISIKDKYKNKKLESVDISSNFETYNY